MGGAWDQFVDRLQHLVLPTLTLALGAIAGYSRYQRNAMLDVLGQDFIRTARAKGLTRRQALFKHGLRTALIPMATLFAYGVGGSGHRRRVHREDLRLARHGRVGRCRASRPRTPTSSPRSRCSPACTILLAGLLSDVIYAALDPRVRVAMSEPVTTDLGIDGQIGRRRRQGSRRGARWCGAGSCATGPPWPPLVLLVLLFVGCYALPPLLPYDYTDLDYYALQQPPTLEHWFGTNAFGQDLLAQTLRGMQKSLLIGVCVAFISTAIAATVGADRRLLRRLARPRADVGRRPAAGRAEFPPDRHRHPAHSGRPTGCYG